MEDLKYQVNPSLWTKYLKGEMGIWGEHDIQELLQLAGSVDQESRQKALKSLGEKWNVLEGRDANNEKVIVRDLCEEFEALPEDVKESILINLLSIEITRGCNGGCYYCYYGEKKGVSHKYSFESLIKFFGKYGDQIQDKAMLRPYLFLDSDPLDYKDGDKRFVDLYREVIKTCPRIVETLSTSLPPGTEKDLVDLVCEIALTTLENHWQSPSRLRLSVGKHNVKRMEACLQIAEKILLEKVGSKEVVREVLWKVLEISPRSEDMGLQKVGPLRTDDIEFADAGSAACMDGFVLSPDNSRNAMLVANTPFDPFGEADLDLSESGGKVIMRDSLFGYYLRLTEGEGFDLLDIMLNKGDALLSDAVYSDGTVVGYDYEEYDLSFRERDLYLSRSILSLNYGLCLLEEASLSGKIDREKRGKLYEKMESDFRDKARTVSSQLEKYDVASRGSTAEIRSRFEYFQSLWEMYKTKFELVFDLREEMGELAASFLVVIINKIDRNNIDSMEDMVVDIGRLTPNNREAIGRFVEKYFGKDSQKDRLVRKMSRLSV